MADAFSIRNRRAVRAPLNPADKSTIVSIMPYQIIEKKPTLFPGVFSVPAGSYENPGILVIGASSWWREIDEDQPLLEVPVSSFHVAQSVVNDYCNAQLGNNNTNRKPGLFYVTGDKTVAQIKKEHSAELNKAAALQKEWYISLVKIADVLWARSQGNPLSVSDTARAAAKFLQLDKPWMQDFKQMAMVNCPACGALRVNSYPVCSSCKTIVDPERFKALGLQVAS